MGRRGSRGREQGAEARGAVKRGVGRGRGREKGRRRHETGVGDRRGTGVARMGQREQ